MATLTHAIDADGNVVSADHVTAHEVPMRPRGLTCYACGATVFGKAGPQVEPHFAHKTGASCFAASGNGGGGALESIEHLNAKLHLAGVLRGMSENELGPVFVRVCEESWCQAQDEHRPFAMKRGDVVDVEKRPLAKRLERPDVLVTRDGIPVAAFEVVVTHAREPASMQRLVASVPIVAEMSAESAMNPAGRYSHVRILPAHAAFRCPEHSPSAFAGDATRERWLGIASAPAAALDRVDCGNAARSGRGIIHPANPNPRLRFDDGAGTIFRAVYEDGNVFWIGDFTPADSTMDHNGYEGSVTVMDKGRVVETVLTNLSPEDLLSIFDRRRDRRLHVSQKSMYVRP